MESYTELSIKPSPALPLDPTALTEDQQIRIAEEGKLSIDERRQNRVIETLNKHFEFVRVLSVGETGQIYYRPAPDMVNKDEIYRPLTKLDGLTLVRNVYKGLYRTATARKVESTYDTLCLDVTNSIEDINGRYIQVANNAYWDVDTAELAYQTPHGCMRRLFDSHPKDELRVDITGVSFVKSMIKKVVEYLEAHNGLIDPNDPNEWVDKDDPWLAPFWTWANYDTDTFNDLLKATASNFMANKPKGAFILIGRTRNGKSSYIKMLHTMFGRNNTSAVKLASLQDPHQNMTLLTTMLNAPDEEDEGKGKELLQSQSFFKSIAAHEPISLNVMYSQAPQLVSTNFMSFFPMNKIPEWTGSATEALMRRSLILMFNNDLSKFDNNGHNFEKETYTASFYSNLLPVLLGIATYYRDKEMTFSKTLRKNQKSIAEELDSVSTYLGLFFKHFGGYDKPATVWEDYKLWCMELGLRYEASNVLREKLKIYGDQQDARTRVNGQQVRYHIVTSKNELPPFIRQQIVPGTPLTIEQTITDWEKHGSYHHGQSVIGLLEGDEQSNNTYEEARVQDDSDLESIQEMLDL